MESDLAGSVVVITGASGGIGWATAEAFAAEGARLVLHGHQNHQGLAQRVAAAPWAPQAITCAGDLREEATHERLFTGARERFGRVDVAILCAGIWPPEILPLAVTASDRLREVLDTNLLAVLLGARAFLRELTKTGPRSDGQGASLALVGSTAGRFGEAGHCAYAASKAALYGILRSLKNEIVAIDPYGRVNLVEPGWTATPMARAALEDPAMVTAAVATMPLRQLARPIDVARALVFFSSPALARHLSGEILTVAGGMEGRRLWTPEAIDLATLRQRMSEESD